MSKCSNFQSISLYFFWMETVFKNVIFGNENVVIKQEYSIVLNLLYWFISQDC